MKISFVKQLATVFLMILFIPQNGIAQLSSVLPEGFGIEFGMGHNQLFWQAEEIDGTTINVNRTVFSVMPSARISYKTWVSSNTGIYTFFGYNEFGGRSEENVHLHFNDDEVLYKDRIRFQNLEAGIFGLFRVSAFNVGMGTKLNRHLRMTNRSHFQNHPQGQDGWNTSEIDFFFNDWSVDAGIRMEYLHITGISLGAEGWFGLSNLSDVEEITMNIRQNHFRVLAGYNF